MSGRKKLFVTCCCVAVAAFSLVSTHAQKKGKAPAPGYDLQPVSADFRCPLASDCTTAARVDRISGDGAGPYRGTTGKNDGAYFVDSNYDFWLYLTASYGRAVDLDFSDQIGTAPCATQGGCRKNFVVARAAISDPPSITRVFDAAGVVLPNGFVDIPVGGAVAGRFKFNFPDPAGRALLWTIRFNPESYPGSSDLTVTRTSENTWDIEASVDDVAELVAVPTKGKAIMTHEGFYTMPFKITVTR